MCMIMTKWALRGINNPFKTRFQHALRIGSLMKIKKTSWDKNQRW